MRSVLASSRKRFLSKNARIGLLPKLTTMHHVTTHTLWIENVIHTDERAHTHTPTQLCVSAAYTRVPQRFTTCCFFASKHLMLYVDKIHVCICSRIHVMLHLQTRPPSTRTVPSDHRFAAPSHTHTHRHTHTHTHEKMCTSMDGSCWYACLLFRPRRFRGCH